MKCTESFSDSFNLVVQVTKGVNFGENHSNFSEMCYYYDFIEIYEIYLKVKFG